MHVDDAVAELARRRAGRHRPRQLGLDHRADAFTIVNESTRQHRPDVATRDAVAEQAATLIATPVAMLSADARELELARRAHSELVGRRSRVEAGRWQANCAFGNVHLLNIDAQDAAGHRRLLMRPATVVTSAAPNSTPRAKVSSVSGPIAGHGMAGRTVPAAGVACTAGSVDRRPAKT